MSKLLLLSNSTMPGEGFLAWPQQHIKSFLTMQGSGVFIPYAAVTFPFNEYGSLVELAFKEMGYDLRSIHASSDLKNAIEQAAFIVVGGGNSFALLARMYEYDLLEVVREKVLLGTPYIGWSAGANLACPTIMTTNDMPIIQPPSLTALNLIPFQINPHYHELKFEGQGGETRRERLEEFLLLNPDKKVIGLPEGMLLQREEDKLRLKGSGVAKLYQANIPIQHCNDSADLSFLLH
jgi:dipeptidase E